MDDLVHWSMEIEDAARRFYEKAALRFSHDPTLSSLLAQLARDEQSHYDMIRKLRRRTDGAAKRYPGLVAVDRAAMERVEVELAACAAALEEGDLSPDGVIEALVTIEFSECNEIFLYVINSLRADREDFVTAGAHIQMHRGVIKRFLASRPRLGELLDRIERLPSLGRQRVLLAGSAGGVTEVLESVLALEGSVETADSVDKALESLAAASFTVVVADIDCLDADPKRLHDLAVDINPALRGRFIFLTGSAGAGTQALGCREHGLVIVKPATIDTIKEAMFRVTGKGAGKTDDPEGGPGRRPFGKAM